VTVRPGRSGTPLARHYDLAARSSLHGSGGNAGEGSAAPDPKSPRWSAERRARPAGRAPRLARHGGRAPKRATMDTAPFGAPLAPYGVDGKEDSKTRARKRAAGTKKTALFDIVNRNDAATRPVPRAREGACRHAPPSCPGQARASASILGTVSIRAREPGPRGDTTCRFGLDIALRTFLAGSRVSLRSLGTRERNRCARLLRMRARESPRGPCAPNHLGAIASQPSAWRANSCAVMGLPNSGPWA
jgi:hypothetical protein